MSEQIVEGRGRFSKQVEIQEIDKYVPKTDDLPPAMASKINAFYKEQEMKASKQKEKTSRVNSYATENMLRKQFDTDKKNGMSDNDLRIKYRKV
jgi:hypothetical protein